MSCRSLAFIAAALTLAAVPAAAATDCRSATKQADLAGCAYEDFVAAHEMQTQASRAFTARLDAPQRKRWDSAQAAWIRWRTTQCDFESAGVGTGSARDMLQWRCVARMTRDRTASIERLANCKEGDLACLRKKK